MTVRLLLWNLAESKTSLDELRQRLPAIDGYVWISDEATERFGVISFSDSSEAEGELAGIRDLIGKDPDIGEQFDVEATVEGEFEIAELSRRGLAFET